MSVQDFTSTGSNTVCGNFVYTVEMSTDGGTTYVALASPFTFTSGSPSSLSVSTSTISHVNTYKIRVSG